MEFLWLILKLLLAFSVVIALMLLLYKVSETKLKQISSNKYMKVLERTMISKDSGLLLVKLGEEAYVMSLTNNKTEILKKLEKEELETYENNKVQETYENILGNYLKKKQKGETDE